MNATVLSVEWSQGIEDAWSDVASFVPKFLGFLVILVVGYLIAKAIAKIADKALERVGFDRAIERGGIGRAMEKTKYDPSDVVAKVIFYALFLIVLQMAFGVFGTNPVSDLIQGVIAYLPKVLAAILIIVVAAAIAAAVKELIEASLGGLSYGRALALGTSVAILVVGVFAALNQLQIATAIVNGLFYALLAIVAGSAIIAIGGGGIGPMRQRWERALQRLDTEMPNIRSESQGRRTESPTGPSSGRSRCSHRAPTARPVPGVRGDPTIMQRPRAHSRPSRRPPRVRTGASPLSARLYVEQGQQLSR